MVVEGGGGGGGDANDVVTALMRHHKRGRFSNRTRRALTQRMRDACAALLAAPCNIGVPLACRWLCDELERHGTFTRLGIDYVMDLVHPRAMWPLLAQVTAGVLTPEQAADACDRLQALDMYAELRLYARRLARTDQWEMSVSFFSDRHTLQPVHWVPLACTPWRVVQAIQVLLLNGCFLHQAQPHLAYMRTQAVEYRACHVADLALRRCLRADPHLFSSRCALFRRCCCYRQQQQQLRHTTDDLDGWQLLDNAGFVQPLPIVGIAFLEKPLQIDDDDDEQGKEEEYNF